MGAPHVRGGRVEAPPSLGCVSPLFVEKGAPGNVSHGAPQPPGRGKRRGRAPDPGRRVPVEHWLKECVQQVN